ncbi:MAG: DUF4124 domain-containing protein [Desulfatibacillum sp.]|nr:DUF4124 domain-containing protein [Desulfatibacillum sp.]
MRKIVPSIFAAVLLFSWTQTGLAEIYSYKDENGVLVFTDTPPDAAQVAPGEVEITKEAPLSPQSQSRSTASQQKMPPKPAPAGQQDPSVQDKDQGPSDQEILEYLQGLQVFREDAKKLKEEKAALQEEADALAEAAKSIRKRSAMRVHNSKVQEMNDKIQELAARAKKHDERRQAYESAHEELREAAARGNPAP